MKTLKMTIVYNGARFFGWQKQEGRRTVQGELETALFALTGQNVTVEGSGRTDKGVHALGQVASVCFDCNIPLKNLKRAINNLLPEDIFVKRVELEKNDFHARFSAKKKTYKYVVQVGGDRPAIMNELRAFYPYEVDLCKMSECAKFLIGKHNFKGFCSSATQVQNFEREIFDLSIKKKGRVYIFEVTGSGFLYNMVRIIVGTLLEFGRNKLSTEDIQKALAGERKHAGVVMPACGLYLKQVCYI